MIPWLPPASTLARHLGALARFLWLGVPDDPFRQPRPARWRPDALTEPPPLSADRRSGSPAPGQALLINPFYAKNSQGSYGKHVLTPALTLTTLAAATPEPWTVRCWDENLLQGAPPSVPLPEVVGITVHIAFARRAYELAHWYRAQGSIVVLGGLHVNACPEEAAAHADAIAIGNGVENWPRILRDLERGTLQKRYDTPFNGAGHNEPWPRRELLPRASFLTTASLIATQGCRNRCAFCYLATRGLRTPYRTTPVDEVRRQVQALEEPYLVFLDNNLGADPAYLRGLCRMLRPLEKIWSAAVTLDVTDDPSLVRDMALAGCAGVFIGFESLSDENLTKAGKRTPRVADYARRVQLLHEHGIPVNGSFVLGFDGDGRDVFQATAQWIETVRLECATFHILTPYPGTPLFRQLEAENRLLHRDWSLYDTAHAVFRPRHLTPAELELGYDWLYRRIFSLASIWHRRPRTVTRVLPYLATALLYKKANRLWYFLIRRQWVHALWRPLVLGTRRRHLAFRRQLERRSAPWQKTAPASTAIPSAPHSPASHAPGQLSLGGAYAHFDDGPAT